MQEKRNGKRKGKPRDSWLAAAFSVCVVGKWPPMLLHPNTVCRFAASSFPVSPGGVESYFLWPRTSFRQNNNRSSMPLVSCVSLFVWCLDSGGPCGQKWYEHNHLTWRWWNKVRFCHSTLRVTITAKRWGCLVIAISLSWSLSYTHSLVGYVFIVISSQSGQHILHITNQSFSCRATRLQSTFFPQAVKLLN